MKKLFVALIFPLALTVFVACGDQASVEQVSGDIFSAVLGGVEVQKNTVEASSVVVVFNDEVEQLCTGTFIAKNIVLTAGHCVDRTQIFSDDGSPLTAEQEAANRVPTTKARMKIYFGRTDFQELRYRETDPRLFKKNEFEVAGLLRHPNYKKNNDERFDVAVILLKEPEDASKVKSLENAVIAELATEKDRFDVGSKFWLVGYGRSDGKFNKFFDDDTNEIDPDAPSTDEPPERPQRLAGWGILRKVPRQVDSYFYRSLDYKISQLDGAGSCEGDSGAPGFIYRKNGQPVVVAVASAVFGWPMDPKPRDVEYDFCAQKSVFMNVTNLNLWIHGAISKLQSEKTIQ